MWKNSINIDTKLSGCCEHFLFVYIVKLEQRKVRGFYKKNRGFSKLWNFEILTIHTPSLWSCEVTKKIGPNRHTSKVLYIDIFELKMIWIRVFMPYHCLLSEPTSVSSGNSWISYFIHVFKIHEIFAFRYQKFFYSHIFCLNYLLRLLSIGIAAFNF